MRCRTNAKKLANFATKYSEDKKTGNNSMHNSEIAGIPSKWLA